MWSEGCEGRVISMVILSRSSWLALICGLLSGAMPSTRDDSGWPANIPEMIRLSRISPGETGPCQTKIGPILTSCARSLISSDYLIGSHIRHNVAQFPTWSDRWFVELWVRIYNHWIWEWCGSKGASSSLPLYPISPIHFFPMPLILMPVFINFFVNFFYCSP